MQCCAIEVAPLLGSLHGFLEVHGEDGPIGTIREKLGDIGGDFHSSKMSVVLIFVAVMNDSGSDKTRAHKP